MREIAGRAIQELDLDYTVTLVSGGATKNFEIVIWDKPRGSYFSLSLTCEPGTPADTMVARIKGQLNKRLAALRFGNSTFRERKPQRTGARPTGGASRVA